MIGDGSALVKALTAFNIDFGDGSETGVEEIVNSKWYDLSGRKLTNTPSLGEGRGRLTRGLYINNGRKVVIK